MINGTIRPNANDVQSVYMVSPKELERLKKEYIWWPKVDAMTAESNIITVHIPRKDTVA